MINHLPKYISNKAIVCYIMTLLIVSILFYEYSMNFMWWLFGIIEVYIFFHYANKLSYSWLHFTKIKFEKELFKTALVIRIIYVIFSYFFFIYMNDHPFDFAAADVFFYNDTAADIANEIKNGNFNIRKIFSDNKTDFSDSGYIVFLFIIYLFTGNSIFIARIVKCILGAYMCVLIYRIAQRNFDERVAKLSSIFVMLMPNLIMYCGLHLKEVEMTFLAVLFINQADIILHNYKLKIKDLFLVLCIIVLLFSFRTVLALVCFISFVLALLITKKTSIKKYQKIVISIISLIILSIFISIQVADEVSKLTNTNVQEFQENSMIHRYGDVNNLAKYAGASVFAPMIFTIPFATMVDTPNQDEQRMIHGGNFVKNIISFFTILSLFSLLFSKGFKNIFKGEWRNYILLISFTCGYLIVLVFSQFAQSERFHQPILPFILLFAAYGVINLKPKQKQWYTYWLILIFIANVAWAWFKLKGRGLI